MDKYDNFYVIDAPGVVSPNKLEYHILHNMRDFLRIRVDGARPQVEPDEETGIEDAQGSRASSKFLWHSTINLKTINGQLKREPDINEVGPGHIN